MKIAIFGNSMKAAIKEDLAHLIEFLQLRGIDIVLSQELRSEMSLRQFQPFIHENGQREQNVDFVLSIGGDGTFLTTASAVGDSDIPILGINCGHLGFLTNVQTRDMDYILDLLIQGKYTLEERSLLHVTCSEGGYLASPYALNEVAIQHNGPSSMLFIEVLLNGEYLHTYNADGLIISTATGSTAYNLSIGGPIMMPDVNGIVLTPLASHSLTVRPLVIADNKTIDIHTTSRAGTTYMVSVDGRGHTMGEDITLHIEKAPHTIKLVQIDDNSFIRSLKNKMHWGEK